MGLFNSIRLGSSAAGDYEIERSIRNDQGTADVNNGSNFEHTYSSAGNRKTFTISVWVKICNVPGNIGDDQYSIFSTGGGGSGAQQGNFFIRTDACLQFSSQPQPSANAQFVTTRKFRDFSAWYHIVVAVDTTQATQSNRVKIYVNGVQETDFSTETYPSQNDDLQWNHDVRHRVGSNSLGSNLNSTYGNFNGYIAEFNFIDGTALTPSSFAETDAVTGEYKPKKFVGSYGTNGFYLNFSDNSGTTATTLGKDYSGNGNNFTPNGYVTGDAVKDSPTNNFATLRTHSTPEASGVVLAEGKLKYTTGSTGGAGTLNRIAISTFLPTSGKWYAEVIPTSGAGNQAAGIVPYTVEESSTTDRPRYNILNFNNGDILQNLSGSGGTLSGHGDSVSTNDVLCIYMDMDAKTVYYGKNGQWADGSGNWDQSTPTSGLSLGNSFFNYKTGGHEGFAIAIMSVTGGASITCIANFGQDSTFAGTLSAGGNADANGIGDFKHTVPANALAMCSANLPEPTIKLPNKHFEARAYTGTGAANTQTLTGFEFAPDMVWGKNRTSAYNHGLFDTVRGATNRLWPNLTNVEASNNSISAFTSDGYTVGTDAFNENNVVTWNWNAGGSTVTNTDGSVDSQVRANTSAGFSIVTFSGSGNRTIGHGLGVAPQVIIMKGRNVTDQWTVGHHKLDASNPWHKGIPLNTTASTQDNAGFWNDTAPTSTVFSKGTWDEGYNMVAYCFSEVKNYSKFGSYRGNQNTKGSFIYTGFEPALVITKGTWGGNWNMYDNKRNPYNVANKTLYPNLSNAESTENSSGNQMDLLSNGFKLRGSNNDTNHAADFIYLAFAESPFKYSRAR